MAVMMVVTAMLVVVMVVAVIMRMIMMIGMIVGMIMRRVVMSKVVMGVMVVRVACRMRVVIAIIGAAFGIERRFDFDHPRAQPHHHFLDHMVTPDAQRFGQNLRRQMTVAEMPGDANQMLRIGATDFRQALRRCDHLDQTAILEHQRIAAT